MHSELHYFLVQLNVTLCFTGNCWPCYCSVYFSIVAAIITLAVNEARKKTQIITNFCHFNPSTKRTAKLERKSEKKHRMEQRHAMHLWSTIIFVWPTNCILTVSYPQCQSQKQTHIYAFAKAKKALFVIAAFEMIIFIGNRSNALFTEYLHIFTAAY